MLLCCAKTRTTSAPLLSSALGSVSPSLSAERSTTFCAHAKVVVESSDDLERAAKGEGAAPEPFSDEEGVGLDWAREPKVHEEACGAPPKVARGGAKKQSIMLVKSIVGELVELR